MKNIQKKNILAIFGLFMLGCAGQAIPLRLLQHQLISYPFIKHVVTGEFDQKNGRADQPGLQAGLHTFEGLCAACSHTSFTQKNPIVSISIYPNGVGAITLSRQFFATKNAFKQNSIQLAQKRINGIKSLWPLGFSIHDITELINRNMSDQLLNTICNTYDNRVRRIPLYDEETNIKFEIAYANGKLVSAYPYLKQLARHETFNRAHKKPFERDATTFGTTINTTSCSTVQSLNTLFSHENNKYAAPAEFYHQTFAKMPRDAFTYASLLLGSHSGSHNIPKPFNTLGFNIQRTDTEDYKKYLEHLPLVFDKTKVDTTVAWSECPTPYFGIGEIVEETRKQLPRTRHTHLLTSDGFVADASIKDEAQKLINRDIRCGHFRSITPTRQNTPDTANSSCSSTSPAPSRAFGTPNLSRPRSVTPSSFLRSNSVLPRSLRSPSPLEQEPQLPRFSPINPAESNPNYGYPITPTRTFTSLWNKK